MGVREEVDGVMQERVVERGGTVNGGEGKVEKVVDEQMEGKDLETEEVERQIEREIDKEILSEKGRVVALKDKFKDLFSERQIVVRHWDLTALALEGAAAGVTVAGLVVLLLRQR
ncbi:MAG: hypothetical protein Q9225_003837 [Loekoesia sp. 1 TL-2023]